MTTTATYLFLLAVVIYCAIIAGEKIRTRDSHLKFRIKWLNNIFKAALFVLVVVILSSCATAGYRSSGQPWKKTTVSPSWKRTNMTLKYNKKNVWGKQPSPSSLYFIKAGRNNRNYRTFVTN